MNETEKAIEEYQSEVDESRKRWGSGPWDNEPDRIVGTALSFATLMVRGPSGHWCGYVGVPKGHPAYGHGYDDLSDIEVHGGLTYSEKCSGHVCHVTDEPDDLWWFGFDCAHSGDQVPSTQNFFKETFKEMPEGTLKEAMSRLATHKMQDTYRDVAFVQWEILKLAEQLNEWKHG